MSLLVMDAFLACRGTTFLSLLDRCKTPTNLRLKALKGVVKVVLQ